MAQSEFHPQFRIHFPGVLCKRLKHVAPVRRKRPGTDFGVRTEQSQSSIRDVQAGRWCAAAAVAELEASVLIVCAAGHSSDVDLIKIVLTGAFEESAELDGMVLP